MRSWTRLVRLVPGKPLAGPTREWPEHVQGFPKEPPRSQAEAKIASAQFRTTRPSREAEAAGRELVVRVCPIACPFA